MSCDPRIAAISRRLDGVSRVVAVTGGKGGIGKSLIASTLALALADRRCRVGLLDLDLTGPCAHLILGAEGASPVEEFGLRPPRVHGLQFMSVTHFIGSDPAPLRGADVTNAMIELLAITRWDELDVLLVDMPPGLGDAALDAIRLIERASYLVVATPSKVVLETVRRTVGLLAQTGVSIEGIVENMARDALEDVASLAAATGLPFLGSLPFDRDVEDAIGHPSRLSGTVFAAAVGELAQRLARDSTGQSEASSERRYQEPLR